MTAVQDECILRSGTLGAISSLSLAVFGIVLDLEIINNAGGFVVTDGILFLRDS
jgi:hypothetical protein